MPLSKLSSARTKNLGFVAALSAVGMVVPFLLQYLLVKKFSLELYGRYAACEGVIAIVVAFACLGFPGSVRRTMAEFKVTRFAQAAPFLIRILLLSAVAFGLLMLIAVPLRPRLGTFGEEWGVGICLAGLASAALLIVSQTVNAMKKVRQGEVIRLVCTLAALVAIIFLPSSPEIDAGQIMLVRGLAVGGVLLVFLIAKGAFRRSADSKPEHSSWSSMGSWLLISLPMLGSSLGINLNQRLDVVILDQFAPSEEVGTYAVFARLAAAMTVLVAITIRANMSRIAHMLADGNKSEAQSELNLIARILTVAATVAGLGLWLVSPLVFRIFEIDTGGAARPLSFSILLAGFCFVVATGPATAVLNLVGGQVHAMLGLWSSVALNLCLNLILVPKMGMMGAAIATGISLVAFKVILLIILRTKYQLKTALI